MIRLRCTLWRTGGAMECLFDDYENGQNHITTINNSSHKNELTGEAGGTKWSGQAGGGWICHVAWSNWWWSDTPDGLIKLQWTLLVVRSIWWWTFQVFWSIWWWTLHVVWSSWWWTLQVDWSSYSWTLQVVWSDGHNSYSGNDGSWDTVPHPHMLETSEPNPLAHVVSFQNLATSTMTRK